MYVLCMCVLCVLCSDYMHICVCCILCVCVCVCVCVCARVVDTHRHTEEDVNVHVQVHCTAAPESVDVTPYMKTPSLRLGAPNPSSAVGQGSHHLLSSSQTDIQVLIPPLGPGCPWPHRHLFLPGLCPRQPQDTHPRRWQPERQELTAS